MSKVFISGSISMKQLPCLVAETLTSIIKNKIDILVGDADGVDTQVQKYCKNKNYTNLTIYSIYSVPRNKLDSETFSKFIKVNTEAKREREKQKSKDLAMTLDSDYSLVIWDGKSLGSYNNILRAIENKKKIRVYLVNEGHFFDPKSLNRNEVEFYYRNKNGYSASEIVETLATHCGFDYNDKHFANIFFKDTKSFNKFLLGKSLVIKKEVNGKSIYQPMPEYKHLFFIENYRGQIKGIKFRNQFIDWIETYIKKSPPTHQEGFRF